MEAGFPSTKTCGNVLLLPYYCVNTRVHAGATSHNDYHIVYIPTQVFVVYTGDGWHSFCSTHFHVFLH